MRKRQWLAGASALLLVACGSTPDDDGPDPTPEPTVEPRVAEDLVAALPDDDELPDGARDIRRCPGAEQCFGSDDGDQGIVFSAPEPEGLDAGEQEELRGQAEGSDWTQIRVLEADMTVIDEHVESLRSELAELDGAFDFEAEEIGEGYAPGQRGSGRLKTTTVDGWEALEHTSTAELVDPDGADLGTRHDATILLRSERMLVEVRTYLTGFHPESAAEDLVRALTKQYLDRLASV